MKYWNSLLLCALLLLTGCLSDGDIVPDDSNKVVLELTLCSSANPTGTTRALTTLQEENISDMKILAFDENGKLLAVHDNIGTLNYDNQTDISKVTIKMKPEAWLGKNVTFMLLGNMTGNASLPNDLTVGTTTYQEVLTALKYTVNTNWPTDNSRHFPMYGTYTTTLNQSQLSGTVWMLRALARVQFYVYNGVGKTVTEGTEDVSLFDMTSIHVFYPRTEGYFCPGTDYSNTDASTYSIHTLNTFGQKNIDNPLNYTLATDGTEKWKYERSIYIPEAVNTSDTQQRVILVVGGFSKGATTPSYYRVEFENDKTHNHIDILRNYTYDFNITGVNGPGKPTPEDALVDGIQLTVQVREWNEVEVAMGDVSPYKLEVSESLVAVNNKAQEYIIDVETTYKDGWVYDTSSKEGDWYTVTADPTTGKLTLTITANGGNIGRFGCFTIHAGDIVKQINVTQTPQQTSNCYIQNEPGLKSLQADVMGNGTYGTEIEGTNLVTSMTSLTGATYDDNGVSKPIYNSDGTIDKNAIKGARIIWQSRPGLITSVGDANPDSVVNYKGILKYTVGEPVTRSSISGDWVSQGYAFDKDGKELGGNAVIGIFTKDGSADDDWGDCIWSWHIWVVWDWDNEATDQHFLTNGVKSGFFMQDRNLGAMRNERHDPYSFGLLYEWGRKDPMRSTSSFATPYVFSPTYGLDNESNSTTWHTWSGGTAFTNILTSVQNPMNFSDLWGGGESANGALWGNPAGNTIISGSATSTDATKAPYNGTQVWYEGKKSIYDPCPLGYRVPSVNGFYFGKTGMAMVIHDADGNEDYPFSYCDLDDVGANSDGYIIYYFGQYKKYEKYSTWMPMTPFYEGTHTALTSPKAGSEGFAYTWLNCPSGGNKVKAEMMGIRKGGNKGGAGSGMVVGWHPKNYHIHEYGSFGASSNNGGTIRCVRETDPDLVPATVPDKVVLLADAGSSMSFGVQTNRGWHIEINNLSYDWLSAVKVGTDGVKVEATEANLTGQPREGLIYIVLDSGEKYPVKVVQESVSVGGDALTVKCDANSSATREITVPSGAKIALPSDHASDPDFTYAVALTNTTTNTYTLTVTSKKANTSPDPITTTLNLVLSKTDGTDPHNLPIDIKQQEYVIAQGAITLAWQQNSYYVHQFTPPTGVTSVTIPQEDADFYYDIINMSNDGKQTLHGVNNIQLKKGYNLVVMAKNDNLGLEKTQVPLVTISNGSGTSNDFPVTVTQESKASIITYKFKGDQTTPPSIDAIKGVITGQIDNDAKKAYMYISNAAGYYYEIEDAPEWISFTNSVGTVIYPDAETPVGKIAFPSGGTEKFTATTAKTFVSTDGLPRTGTVEIKIYYYDGTEYVDVKTLEFDVTQASVRVSFVDQTAVSGSKNATTADVIRIKGLNENGGDNKNSVIFTDNKFKYAITKSPAWASFPITTNSITRSNNNNAYASLVDATTLQTYVSTVNRYGMAEVTLYYDDDELGTFDVEIQQAPTTMSLTGNTAISASSGQTVSNAITFANGIIGSTYEVLSWPEWMNFTTTPGTVASATQTIAGETTAYNVGSSRSGTARVKIKDGSEELGIVDVTLTQAGLGMSIETAELDKESGKTQGKALKIKKPKINNQQQGPYYYKIVTYPSWVSFGTATQDTLPKANEDIQIAGTTTEKNTTGVKRSGTIEVEIYADAAYSTLMGTLTGTITQGK